MNTANKQVTSAKATKKFCNKSENLNEMANMFQNKNIKNICNLQCEISSCRCKTE